MSYEKQTWTTGEVITAEKLNHMEDGIGEGGSGGGLVSLTAYRYTSQECFVPNENFSTSQEAGQHLYDIITNKKPFNVQIISIDTNGAVSGCASISPSVVSDNDDRYYLRFPIDAYYQYNVVVYKETKNMTITAEYLDE